MKHRLRIRVSKTADPGSVVSVKRAKVPKRLWKKLFGGTEQVTIIVPGDSVQRIGIVEIPEGGDKGATRNTQ